MTETAELVDNQFLLQFELKVENEMAIIEYSLQERKIFLTKLIIPDTYIAFFDIAKYHINKF